MARDESSLTVPLVVEEKQRLGHKLEDVETTYSDSTAGTTSSFKTVFHGLNALSGVGILSIPYALSSGGWLSLILLFVISIAAFYSGLLIQRCMDVDSNIRTYPDIGERAFGRKGRLLVSVVMYAELYLVAAGFLILEGDNLQSLFPNMGIEVAGFEIGARQSFVIMVALIILPTVWLDNMSILSYISASGVLASAIILVSIFWTGAFDGVGFKEKGTLVNWHGIPTAVSLYAFCYCAHPVFPTLYTSMKNKHQFSNLWAYLMFGSNVESQITLSLPTHKLSSRLAIYTTLVNPIAKYALMVTPIVKVTKSWFPLSCNNRPLSLFISTAFVISNVTVALSVPFFGDLMSLVGAFLSMTAATVLPCLCYMKISRAHRRFGFEMVVLVSVVLLGISVVVFGTYTSLLQIIGHL
uniref:Amino acid transporter transmembrane domain-containing protein n=1 Tax=Salix viminalis TaxID=40686 RepID=A0A6N2KXM0_SALVM